MVLNGAGPNVVRTAAALLGALPSCMGPAAYPEAWLRTVQSIASSLQQLLVPLLGSVTTRVALPYQLTGYALPGAVSQSAHSLFLASKRGQLGRARATAAPS